MENNVKQRKRVIPKALRMKLWEIECGNTLSGLCFTCNRIVKVDDFQAGHIISEANGGLVTLSNLKVVCKPCNTSCGTMDLHCFKEILETSSSSSSSSSSSMVKKSEKKRKKDNEKEEKKRFMEEAKAKAKAEEEEKKRLMEEAKAKAKAEEEEKKRLMEEAKAKAKAEEEAEKERLHKMVMAHSTNEYITQYPPVYIKHEDSVKFKDFCKKISEKKELLEYWMVLYNARDRFGRKISVIGNKINGYAAYEPTLKW
jgi:flagellar biosynthesis GTPase FlhF